MKFFLAFLTFLLPIVASAPAENEAQFEDEFGKKPITDPKEFKKHEAALKKAEEDVKEVNDDGSKTWKAKINEFSDLDEDEFESEKTGDIKPPQFGRGLLEPTGAERVDEESERYFANFRESMRMNRGSVPSSYSSVDMGYVSPVKNQKQCGSCVAFSNMAAIETCFKKKTGVFGDYSEQQFVDCGYGKNGANGCDGAYTYAYIKWAADSQADLTAEANYLYKNQNPALKCPSNLPLYNQGAKVSKSWYTYKGDEETLKGLVHKHGAVVTSVSAYGPFSDYEGGVFSGCTTDKTDHAVTVVGYGTDSESGKKYWLIKNSWGPGWGENGFIRLERGVGMCGVGTAHVVVECEKVSGPTDAPITTEKPCEDKFSNCAKLAETSCYQDNIKKSCEKSCGLCKGMTPHSSLTCFDQYNNCAAMAKNSCYQDKIGKACKKSCGLCPGMTPAKSYTCYDVWSNCGDLCSNKEYAKNQCKKACGNC